jgi:Flp pilus assembly secretin CpaC
VSKASERGRRGGEVKAAKGRAQRAEQIARAQAVTLRTAEEMRAALERALGRVESLGEDPIAMANAVARLVTANIQVHQQIDLVAQVAELERKLAERLNPGGDEWPH